MVGERIKKLREERGITRQKLAEIVGVSTTSLYYIEKGINIPSSTLVAKIAEALGVTTDYLLGLTDDPRPITERAGMKPLKGKIIPVFDGAAAGNGGKYPDGSSPVEYIQLPEGVMGEFGVKVYGDSMMPEIVDGDIVVVDRRLEIRNNDRVVVILEDPHCLEPCAVVKIYKEVNGSKYLISLNPAYPPILLKEVKFIAKVVYILRKY